MAKINGNTECDAGEEYRQKPRPGPLQQRGLQQDPEYDLLQGRSQDHDGNDEQKATRGGNGGLAGRR